MAVFSLADDTSALGCQTSWFFYTFADLPCKISVHVFGSYVFALVPNINVVPVFFSLSISNFEDRFFDAVYFSYVSFCMENVGYFAL